MRGGGRTAWADFEEYGSGLSHPVAGVVDRFHYEAHHPTCRWLNNDISGDGVVDFDDINPFVDCLAAQGCP